jgi:hypothetical protein
MKWSTVRGCGDSSACGPNSQVDVLKHHFKLVSQLSSSHEPCTGSFSDPKQPPISLEAPPISPDLPASDELLSSFLHSVGAASALPQFRAAGLSDHSLEEISGFAATHIEGLGLTRDQAEQFSICVGQHLTVRFLEREAAHSRELVESGGYDYSVFESLDTDSQKFVLLSLEGRRGSRSPPPPSPT